MTARESIGLIAGNGRFPVIFARAAKRDGLRVVALGYKGETEPALAQEVDHFEWVHLGQIGRIAARLRKHGVTRVAMAGGIGKLNALRHVRLDWKAVRVAASMRSFNDDALLKAVATFFESEGLEVVPSTLFLGELLAPEGLLTRRPLTPMEERDVELGREVALALGKVDVGQTVVTKDGSVIAVEAAEGTDACIRRAGALAGPGIVVVKRCKVIQDERFDLPAVGPRTAETIAEVGGTALAIEAGKALLLDAEELTRRAEAAGIAIVGFRSEHTS